MEIYDTGPIKILFDVLLVGNRDESDVVDENAIDIDTRELQTAIENGGSLVTETIAGIFSRRSFAQIKFVSFTFHLFLVFFFSSYKL